MNFHEWWGSIEHLSRVIMMANWGIALSLLIGFACTVLAIKAGNKRDKLIAVEDSKKEQKVADTLKLAADANERAGKANERAATLEVEALKLRTQLASQGPRANLLTGENRRRLVAALQPFSGQRIDIRHSASTILVNGAVVMSTPIGDDALGLANTLIEVLREAGWNMPPKPLISGLQGTGLDVEVLPGASPETRAAAKALAEALRDVPLEVDGPSQVTDDRAKRVGTELILPSFGENTIVLDVLTHP
jgi:hypothetical protein